MKRKSGGRPRRGSKRFRHGSYKRLDHSRSRSRSKPSWAKYVYDIYKAERVRRDPIMAFLL